VLFNDAPCPPFASHGASITSRFDSARTPDGSKKLFDELSFEVSHGDPLLIMGPSGSGKTSLLRIVAGLWPFQQGQITRPASLFFLPQRPYLPLGSMRAQVLFNDAPCPPFTSHDASIRQPLGAGALPDGRAHGHGDRCQG
jgi:ABC-type uncharacterized transport system fused permease/ATPase subunit